MQKELDQTPTVQALDVKLEGVICQSGGNLNSPGDYGNGGDPFTSFMLP